MVKDLDSTVNYPMQKVNLLNTVLYVLEVAELPSVDFQVLLQLVKAVFVKMVKVIEPLN